MLFTYQQMKLGRTLDKYSLESSHNSTSLRKCLILLECWEKERWWRQFSQNKNMSSIVWDGKYLGSRMLIISLCSHLLQSFTFTFSFAIFSLSQKSFQSTNLAADWVLQLQHFLSQKHEKVYFSTNLLSSKGKNVKVG